MKRVIRPLSPLGTSLNGCMPTHTLLTLTLHTVANIIEGGGAHWHTEREGRGVGYTHICTYIADPYSQFSAGHIHIVRIFTHIILVWNERVKKRQARVHTYVRTYVCMYMGT